ncbi:MAG: hypothetical protein IPN77_30760 [Sandaracinaceae bacterium]|nr:hypothetical protein [Sandaracinaceae bacterium]
MQVGTGLPGFDIVGLPERGVRESRVRVKSALQAFGFKLPPRQLVLNLAPGDLAGRARATTWPSPWRCRPHARPWTRARWWARCRWGAVALRGAATGARRAQPAARGA